MIQKEIQKEFADQNITIGILAIRNYLQKGVERSVGSERASEVYKSLWPISETPFEVQQRLRQQAETLAIQFTDPNSKHFLDPTFIPSINQMCKDFEGEGIYLYGSVASPYLKEGVGRVVAPEMVQQIYNEMWPGKEIPPVMQEKIAHRSDLFKRC